MNAREYQDFAGNVAPFPLSKELEDSVDFALSARPKVDQLDDDHRKELAVCVQAIADAQLEFNHRAKNRLAEIDRILKEGEADQARVAEAVADLQFRADKAKAYLSVPRPDVSKAGA